MEYIKAFHIDNGRKYYSLTQLTDLVDVMAQAGYNMLELAVGNDGYRFLLDDMTVETDQKVYASDDVKRAIHEGNVVFCDNGTNELTQGEVETLISYANEKGIQVMTLLNSPGHMDALLTAMEYLGISSPAYRDSKTTVDLDNHEAVGFTKAFLQKLISWFSGKGCRYFNLGSDEYANDVLTSGFASLQNPKEYRYDRFIAYVNDIARMIKSAGMIPVMFNDGVYYNQDLSAGTLDKDIIVSYWSPGWDAYDLAPVSFLEAQGHQILDTSCNWYYVLGRTTKENENSVFTYQTSLDAMKIEESPVASSMKKSKPVGSMFCLWSDEPQAPYDKKEVDRMHVLLGAFNPKH